MEVMWPQLYQSPTFCHSRWNSVKEVKSYKWLVSSPPEGQPSLSAASVSARDAHPVGGQCCVFRLASSCEALSFRSGV